MKPILLIVCCACLDARALAAEATATEATVAEYAPDDSPFPNPERGFYLHHNLDRLPRSFPRQRAAGHTLVWGQIRLGPYKETPELPAEFLAALDAGFETIRREGMKAIVRGSYGSRGPGGDYRSFVDAEPEIILGHIRQLAPLFEKHGDVIALFEAGFVGPWGEWHSTRLADDVEAGRAVLDALLAAAPRERMIVLRYPCLKQGLFPRAGGGYETVDAANAYSGQPVARVGHHNDCFLSSHDDVGTYNRCGASRAEETAYLAAETQYVPYGGESCASHALSDCPRAVRELETLHAVYLNSDYDRRVLSKWREQGCYDEIARRLGARLQLVRTELPRTATPGGPWQPTIELKNVGFASLYNPRPVEIVLTPTDGAAAVRLPVAVDPRTWKAGETCRLRPPLKLPANLPPGEYAVALALPDPNARLRDDPRYAYRCANTGVWDDALGGNRLTGIVTVGDQARAP